MLEVQSKTIYKAFGLNISSEIHLPELYIETNTKKIDVVIKREDLSQEWIQQVEPSKKYITNEYRVLFQIENTAIFCVQDGNTIIVSADEDGNEDKIRLYILGTCMAILLMQKRILPLHGSVIAINDKAYAIVGHRGAGKSTLAAAFLQEGYKVLTDDIISVSLDESNYPYVIPSYPQQKLWQESLIEFGISSENLQPLFERETKYAVPITEQFHPNPLPLAGVFELIKTGETETISLEPILGLNKLHKLYAHTFRQFLLNRVGIRAWHFQTTALVAPKIDMYQIKRPQEIFTANQLVTLILDTLNKG